jgi:hypothetical protein
MFSKYLLEAEIASTKRKGMMHLEKAKPSEFLELARDIMQSSNGVLKDVKIGLKVDGAGIRFGKDSQGRFFFETSRSGPIQTSKAFSAHASLKDGADLTRAAHYDDMFEAIKNSKLWKDLPSDTKVVAEIMYNPMAEVIKDKVKFVSVTYDKSKLGSLMTIIPFDVVTSSTGKDHPEKDSILKSLIAKSICEVKVESANLKGTSFDVQTILKPIFALGSDIDTVLASRKAVDKDKKELYQIVIQNVKDQLAKFILDHPEIKDKDKFGPEIEGLVLDIGNRQFKVTTADFKASKQK